MRVAVAGARGFIGREVARAVGAAGHEVVAFDREGPPAGARVDALVWAAGQKEADLAGNLEAHVAAPLAALAALGAARVVYLSSGECYGRAPVPFREDGPALGDSDYARAKLRGEGALAQLLPTFSLRLGVVYGPGQAPRMLLPIVAQALREGRHLPLSDGRQTRDFVHVDDVASAVVAALAAPVTAAGVINVAAGVETPVREACELLARAQGGAAALALLGFGEVPHRPGEAERYVLDVHRARARLGWQAQVALADGLAALAGAVRV